MVELTAKTPCGDLLPFEAGDGQLREIDFGRVTSVAPFDGKETSVSTAFERAIGAGLPNAGRSLTGKSGQVLWAARGQYIVFGAKVPKVNAAVTDQSDAWTCVALEGANATSVLARLCPLDLSAMDEGDVARSLIGHMTGFIIRRSEGYDLMVFRAFAQTLVHELKTIMQSVDAQEKLRDGL